MATAEGRPLRADARRNRDLILTTAARLFAERGPDVPTDTIAKEAGVGSGTLYRHYPSRESLIEAAYRNELAVVCDAIPDLLSTLPPDQATREWMDRFIDYMTTKAGMAEALRAVIAAGGNPYSESRARLGGAIKALIAACAAAGVTRGNVNADDVLMTLSGVALAAGGIDQREQAGRMLDFLMDGLRYKR